MKRYLILLILIFIFYFSFMLTPSHALWWMVYHKPAFKGKVIDAETKEPIAGAVVVVVYDKATMGLGAGALSSIINVREVLTDKEGMFRISSYTTIIQPFSVEDEAVFIIFKPGYGSFPHLRVSPPKLVLTNEPGDTSYLTFEEFFSREVGTLKEFWASEPWKKEEKPPKKIKVAFGIVELPKLKTREERSRNIPSLPTVLDFLEKQKNLILLINEEEEILGLQKSDPYKARESILKMGR